jgi:hypothetical protein
MLMGLDPFGLERRAALADVPFSQGAQNICPQTTILYEEWRLEGCYAVWLL